MNRRRAFPSRRRFAWMDLDSGEIMQHLPTQRRRMKPSYSPITRDLWWASSVALLLVIVLEIAKRS